MKLENETMLLIPLRKLFPPNGTEVSSPVSGQVAALTLEPLLGGGPILYTSGPTT